MILAAEVLETSYFNYTALAVYVEAGSGLFYNTVIWTWVLEEGMNIEEVEDVAYASTTVKQGEML